LLRVAAKQLADFTTKGTIMVWSPLRRLGRWGTFLALLALAGMSGCGPRTGTVSGKVYYNGKLLKGGTVTFVHTTPGKGSGNADIKEDGTYTMPPVAAGTVKICVDTSALKPLPKNRITQYSPPPGQTAPGGLAGPREDVSKRYTAIPKEYADPTTSTLSLDVKGGAQEHDIQLK
jgi:hypothetical protein